MLRNHSDKAADYKRRLDVLVNAGILALPDLKDPASRGRFIDRASFDELSFLFFVAWLYTSIWNRSKDSNFRATWVMLPNQAQTVLALGRRRHPFVLPGTTSKPALFVDDQFFGCTVDGSGVAADRQDQILCPVLNRVRLNLGHTGLATGSPLPPSSRDCCGSVKQRLWAYLGADLAASRNLASAAVGGQALPVRLDSAVAERLATGLEATSNDLGAVFEETLLVYALIAADAPMGIAHFAFKQPFLSNEIDFAIYDTRGHKSGDDWETKIAEQSLCAWEVTCGHLAEAGAGNGSDDGISPTSAPGSDHPHKKLVNFMALKTLGFANLQFHYVSVLPPKDISAATTQALQNTDGFTYWCLGAKEPGLETEVLSSLEAGLDVPKLRAWHQAIVEQVEVNAHAFANACASSAPVPAP